MAIIRCINGNNYDTEKSNDCPYCKMRRENWGSSWDDDPVTVGWPGGSRAITIQEGRGPHVSGMGSDGEPLTVGLWKKHSGTALVTGWLVCIEGPMKGRDYRISYGSNKIGSSYNMDICLAEDPKIQQEEHCFLIYEPNNNCFFIRPGGGSNTYLNGELLKAPQELHLGDEISMGSCKFEFVPFCREGRVWK